MALRFTFEFSMKYLVYVQYKTLLIILFCLGGLGWTEKRQNGFQVIDLLPLVQNLDLKIKFLMYAKEIIIIPALFVNSSLLN